MHPSRSRRPARPRSRRARLTGAALGLLALLTACADDAVLPVPSPSPVTSDTGTAGDLIVVLPPADGLADAERARIRLLVTRALDVVLPTADAAATTLLEPADAGSHVDTVERAIRRVGAGGTVCVLGADVSALVAPVFALYPATRPCLLPHPDEGGVRLAADVDLEALGRELGAAARAAAGSGTVVVLAGPDPMLDRRWRAGVVVGAREQGGLAGPVHALRSAADLLALLDEQGALLAEGIVPGGSDARTGGDLVDLEPSLGDDLPAARALAPVAVVVLDASREAEQLIGPLAERGVRVVAPRSLLVAAEAPEAGAASSDAVVLRWRIRWDVPLVALMRRASSGEDTSIPPVVTEEVLVLEPGPAHVAP